MLAKSESGYYFIFPTVPPKIHPMSHYLLHSTGLLVFHLCFFGLVLSCSPFSLTMCRLILRSCCQVICSVSSFVAPMVLSFLHPIYYLSNLHFGSYTNSSWQKQSPTAGTNRIFPIDSNKNSFFKSPVNTGSAGLIWRQVPVTQVCFSSRLYRTTT